MGTLAHDVLASFCLTQDGLASMLGVSQKTVSLWASGQKEPSSRAKAILGRMIAALDVDSVVIGKDWNSAEIAPPAMAWEPVLAPKSVFTLPAYLDCSGRPESRAIDPSTWDGMAYLHKRVMAFGAAKDFVVWASPEFMARNLRDLVHPRQLAMWDGYLRAIGATDGA